MKKSLVAGLLVILVCGGVWAGDRADMYAEVRLTADVGSLDADQRRMLRLMIEACHYMDEAFWLQAYGEKYRLLGTIEDTELRRFAEINYGPWDRLGGNAPFLESAGPKPAGATFYPADMTREEFEKAAPGDPELESLYSIVRRDTQGGLVAVPYHAAFAPQVGPAAGKLIQAAALATDPGLKRYLELRAVALITDDYRPSDMGWMEMKDNAIDVVIGPIETYEDQLFGYKAAFEGYVLIKDLDWSRRLARYASMLPALQRGLPVPDEYKRETPGTDSELNAYDVV